VSDGSILRKLELDRRYWDRWTPEVRRGLLQDAKAELAAASGWLAGKIREHIRWIEQHGGME
jgi:hypothetical protein